MPTGYTAILEERTDVSFREFALRCVRAFGVCVEMRDDSLDANIPDEFVPRSYHKDSLDKAIRDLESARALTDKDAEREANKDYKKQVREYEETRKKKEVLLDRYQSMLRQASEWTPPSEDHTKLKIFMITQLQETIRFDCSMEHYSQPKKLTGEEYKENLIKSAKRGILYHVEEQKKEEQSAKERTEWIQALRQSLPNE